MKIDGEILELFSAKDEDGGKFGDVTFTISSVFGNDDEDFFEIYKTGSKTSQFRLKKNIGERTYNVRRNFRHTLTGSRVIYSFYFSSSISSQQMEVAKKQNRKI